MNKMKNTITNTMFTTGTSLVVLAVYFLITGENEMGVQRVLEIFGANIVINFGILFRYKFEIKNVILEYFVDVTYITCVLLVFGFIFNWYSAIPFWLLPAMAAGIYMFVVIISVVKINIDAKEINDLLQKRKEKEADNVS